MVKKTKIISIALLLGLSLAPAQADNNLVQLDLKKSANNSVNVTLFTSDAYNDNVSIRKKSDNKYVILIPKVQSSGYSAPALNGVKDLISNVDVKTVNDGAASYTKVTLITTKPVDIKTSTQKTQPLTDEQKEYKTLIAEANSIKNNIGKNVNKPAAKPQKTEITVNKAPKQEVKEVKKVEQAKTKKDVTQSKPEIKLTEITPKELSAPTKKQNQKTSFLDELKQDNIANQIPSELPQVPVIVQDAPENITPVKDVKEIKEVQQKSEKNTKTVLTKLKNKFSKAGFVVFSLLALFVLLNLIKASLRKSNDLKVAFNENINQEAHREVNSAKYDDIVENDELSWREKYQSYLDESAKPVPRANSKGHYAFIRKPADIEDKRQKLEEMVVDIVEQEDVKPSVQPAEVKKEDDVIYQTIKLKAFDKAPQMTSLKVTNRQRINSRFKKYEVERPVKSVENVELGSSILHSNPRRLEDANLKASDVIKNRIDIKTKDYIMSTPEEFFAILDREEKEIAKASVEPVKAEIPKLQQTAATNPIAKKQTKNNNLIIKSSYNIDENKSIYLVNHEGKTALVGKVNDEVSVLKQFDSNVTNPIQVRRDNGNVYMVKAGGFKSLVEVNDDKMGVLIEL